MISFISGFCHYIAVDDTDEVDHVVDLNKINIYYHIFTTA